MTIQQTFSEMRHLMAERIRIQADLARAMDAATRASPVLDGMPRGKRRNGKVALYGTYLADLQARIEKINQKLELFKDDIQSAINAIPVGCEKQVLTLRYIEFLSIGQIAKQMNYERSYMYRFIRGAEDRLVN